MEKMKMHSPDLTEKNIARIAELFPNCITEAADEHGKVTRAIDFDLLRQELSDTIVEGPRERYHLDWPGKREALLAANAPIAKTLRPCREESVDFDTTQNLFLEGDNLDALKLLQETYLGKVKMIYIDPPYNTGKDFVYADNFAESTEEYLLESDQKDDEGNRLVLNADSNGRFHSDWLSMIYSRLKLARNLLAQDGYIVTSIDDAEYDNLKKAMDEVYGGANYVATIVWDRNRKNDAKFFSVGHEYMLVYGKCKQLLNDRQVTLREPKEGIGFARTFYQRLRNKYGADDEAIQKEWRSHFNSLSKDDPVKLLGRFSKISERGPFRDDGNISWPGGNGPKYEVLHPITGKPCKVPDGGWRYSTRERFQEEVESGKVVFGEDETTLPRQCRYLFDSDGQVMTSVHFSYAQTATMDFMKLMDSRLFENPKSYNDIKRLVKYLTDGDSIVLDFFAGSATTAHAVCQANAEDGGNRKFIMVQLPEECDEKSEAFKAGYKTIAEIAKERIRRAGKKILEERKEGTTKNTKGTKRGEKEEGQATLFDEQEEDDSVRDFRDVRGSENLDVGFRVLKVDSSNMKDVYYTPDAMEQDQLFDKVDNIKEDRTPEDLLFQVLLDWGVDLSLPITRERIATKNTKGTKKGGAKGKEKTEEGEGFEVFVVDENALIACFDPGIDEDLVKELAARKPLRVVFRDAGYGSDDVKINVEQIFKLLSPSTEVRTI